MAEINLRRFLLNYPEFKNTDSVLVELKLMAASGRVASAVFGNKTDDAIMLLAAHLLASMPDGENLRLKNENGTTIYESQYKQLLTSAGVAYNRVC